MSTRLLWYIAHRRWEIETIYFTPGNLLVSRSLFQASPHGHPQFRSDPLIAFVLLQSFYYGNLKPQRRTHLTLIGLANELHLGLVTMDIPAPWVSLRGG